MPGMPDSSQSLGFWLGHLNLSKSGYLPWNLLRYLFMFFSKRLQV